MGKLFAQEFLFMWGEIDHQEPSAGTQDTRGFLDGAGAVFQEVQHLMHADKIGATVFLSWKAEDAHRLAA